MSQKLGHFEILSELAKSATCIVYKANDPQTSQTVALKAIQLSAFGPVAEELKACLIEEAESTKGLSHANLAPVFGAGEFDGQFCAAMEYIQGNSIATMLARKEGFSIWDLLDIGRQVCSGLDHAQSHKAFHFSLEPSKIMCGWDGTVRVLGYGVSSVGKFTGQMSGVPSLLHYMSPEQVRGESIDARSNLYSLGAIFYEMVTDRKAFDGEDAEFLRRSVIEGTPVAPALINPKLHPLLSDLIMKALSKDPAARYQTGRELLEDLEKCKETKPQAAKQAAAAAVSAAAPEVKPAPQVKVAAPAEKKVATPGVAAKAAASAGAGWPGGPAVAASPSVKPSVNPARPSASMSSSVVEEPVVAAPAPRIAVDPLMAESGPAKSGSVSFSEMTELPPLKEVYIAPPPPPAVEIEEEEAVVLPVKKQKPEQPKTQPREVAAKAMREVKSVPPRLIAYSVIFATALILIVALALYLHINGLNNDGDSVRPATAAAMPAQPTPAPAEPAVAPPTADTSDLPPASPVGDAETTPWVPAAPAKGNRGGRRTNSAPAAVVAPGQMVVDSTPQGAQVHLDGKTDPSWVTPFMLSGVGVGQHTVAFSKPGYSGDSRSVALASGSKVSVTGRLTQLVAMLSVTSSPAGANIFVDGRNTGKLTPAQVSVDKGQHVILVRKSGYIEETTTAQFALGQTVSFTPSMRPLGNVDNIRTVGKMKKIFGGKEAQGMGTVSIRTQPKGAQIAVNQHMLDKDSPVDFLLDPGNYVIDITMSGYAPVHKIITVDRGAKSVVDEVLQHE